MPHVTFIHGIGNKPCKNRLLENWLHYLTLGGLHLDSDGITSSMVYWADVLHSEPLAAGDDFESVADNLGTEISDEDRSWIETLPTKEKAYIDAFRTKLRFVAISPNGDDYSPEIPTDDEHQLEGNNFEAIPLPWKLKPRVMKAFLKDVHHYLFNANFSPRPGENYQVQDHIRALFVAQLQEDAGTADGAHVVVSHSMGTVISYDCLKNVPDCPAISGFMTVGSPLGISEIHDNFSPDYFKHEAFPSEKVSGNWVNVYDRLDPVALDARLANDDKKNGQPVVIDEKVHNSGGWRHSSYKYYAQQALCTQLRNLLS